MCLEHRLKALEWLDNGELVASIPNVSKNTVYDLQKKRKAILKVCVHKLKMLKH